MEGSFRDKYSFVGEWYDDQASLVRRFNIFYYPVDDTLEMYDIRSRKAFLRRMKVQGVKLDSFYIGCTMNLLGRLVKITDFGCEDTKKKLASDMQMTFALIKPMPINITGKVITHILEQGLRITKIKKARLAAEDALFMLRNLVSDPTYPFLLEHLTNQALFGIELVGKDAVNYLHKILGDSDPQQAEPGTIRALYGTDPVRNCVHAAADAKTVLEDMEYFFPPPQLRSLRLRLTATLSNCTLCIVKPHAIRERKLGKVLELIDEGGFNITALNMLIVDCVNACEFYEVYKGIVPEYKGMVEELSSGECVAMELQAKDKTKNTAVEFRKLVGPSDPEIARLLRPHTIRAKLGTNKVQNTVHCSDLPEDGLLEVEYFFKILEL